MLYHKVGTLRFSGNWVRFSGKSATKFGFSAKSATKIRFSAKSATKFRFSGKSATKFRFSGKSATKVVADFPLISGKSAPLRLRVVLI